MSNFYKKLSNAGVIISDLIENIGGDNTEVIDRIFHIFLEDNNMVKLRKCIENKQYKDAFKYSHTLKGVLASLALQDLYEKCQIVVEKLRNNNYENIEMDFKEFDDEYEKTREKILEALND